jgi:hypothetical protein
MFYEDGLFEVATIDQYIIDDCGDKTRSFVGAEASCVEDMASLIKIVMSIACDVEYKVKGIRGGFRLNKFGNEILHAISLDLNLIMECFVSNRVNPYVSVFEKARNHLKDKDLFEPVISESPLHEDAFAAVESMVNSIRAEAATPVFKRYMRNYERSVRKNSIGVNAFIDKLFMKYSRMLIIRIDLGYSIDYLLSLDGVMSSKRVKNDFNLFLKCLRSGVVKDGVCGYIWKLEFGPVKQFHYHVMIFLDGSKFREDITIAKGLGDEWRNNITSGEGVYYNCNNRLGKKPYSYHALGMASWGEQDKIINIKRAAGYLVKLDLLVRPNLPKGWRTFGKSGEPSKKCLAGRPRKS